MAAASTPKHHQQLLRRAPDDRDEVDADQVQQRREAELVGLH